jgi:hypothetical protein
MNFISTTATANSHTVTVAFATFALHPADALSPMDPYRRRRRYRLQLLILIVLVFYSTLRRKRRNRFYLTRDALSSSPHEGTAWLALYHSRNNQAYLCTMGIGVSVFETLLKAGFQHAYDSQPVPRNDVDPTKPTRLTYRSLDAAGALGLVLHHLNSTMCDKTLQQIFGITPSVCSRYRNWALCLLQATLKTLPAADIKWPTSIEDYEKYTSLIQQRHPMLQKAFGFVDGCHFPVANSGDIDQQNAYYNGWCSSTYTSNIFVFAPDGVIIHAYVNAPGSWHDAAVSRKLFGLLLNKTPEGYWIIGDTAFPKLQGRIYTPPKDGSLDYPDAPDECANFLRFSEELVSARQAAEWGMRCLQGSFSRLKIPMPANDASYRQRLLEVCCKLHNVRTRLEGINQIKTVYEGEWKSGGEDIELGEKLRGVRKNERIRRYYNFIP